MDVGRVVGGAIKLPLEKTPAPKNVEWAEAAFTPEVIPPADVECTLHISDEGYRRWEQAQQDGENSASRALPSAENAGSVDSVDGSAEADGMSSMERLSQFADSIVDVVRDPRRLATPETEDEKVAALEQMRQLKEEQEEEYQRQVKEVQSAAVKQVKTKNIVEKGMRDLTIMLESFKQLEDDKKEDEPQAADKDADKDARQEKPLQKTGDEELPGVRKEALEISSGIRRHASRVERAMDDTINRIFERAQRNMRFVSDGVRTLQAGLASVYEVIAQPEDLSDAERDEVIGSYLADGQRLLGQMSVEVRVGNERLFNLKEIIEAGYGNQNMVYAQRAQNAIGEAADLSVLDGLYQEGFESMREETIDELAKHIHELLDEERMSRTEKAEEAEGTEETEKTEEAEETEAAGAVEETEEAEEAENT